MVRSSHLIDGEWRQNNVMEPITAAIVIVAIWTPIPICLSKLVDDWMNPE